jgi:hypothetical protein
MSLPSRPRTAETAKGPSQLTTPGLRLPASAIGQHRRMIHPTVPCYVGRADRTPHMPVFSTRGRSMKRSRSALRRKDGMDSPQRATWDSPRRQRASATLPSPSSVRNLPRRPGKHQNDPRIRLLWAISFQCSPLCRLRFQGWYGVGSRVRARRRPNADSERRMLQLQ